MIRLELRLGSDFLLYLYFPLDCLRVNYHMARVSVTVHTR